jgi:hypothetical protein
VALSRAFVAIAACAMLGFALPRSQAQTLSAVSSYPALLPSSAITFSGSGASTVVTITPVSDVAGSANVTLFADGNALRIDSSVKVPGQGPLTVRINGSGSVTPDLSGQSLVIGNSYTVNAIPGWASPLPIGAVTSAANGLISGTFKVPGTATVRSFYAALLQNRNAGFGYFLGTNQSGQVRIEAAK